MTIYVKQSIMTVFRSRFALKMTALSIGPLQFRFTLHYTISTIGFKQNVM